MKYELFKMNKFMFWFWYKNKQSRIVLAKNRFIYQKIIPDIVINKTDDLKALSANEINNIF